MMTSSLAPARKRRSSRARRALTGTKPSRFISRERYWVDDRHELDFADRARIASRRREAAGLSVAFGLTAATVPLLHLLSLSYSGPPRGGNRENTGPATDITDGEIMTSRCVVLKACGPPA